MWYLSIGNSKEREGREKHAGDAQGADSVGELQPLPRAGVMKVAVRMRIIEA